jgi:quercetin dioxygenase-like cupin family protein
MLSQVERGETSPTLQVASKIAAGLDLTLSQLLRLDEDPRVTVVRRRDRRKARRAGHVFEELTPGLPGHPHSVTVHTLNAGARTGDGPLHAPGSKETIVVQEGHLALHCSSGAHELDEGDAVTFDADLPHHFTTSEGAVFIAVVTR